MNIDNRAVIPLRVFLMGLFAVLLVFQFLSFPGQFAYMAQQSPDQAYLRWPLTAVAAFLILCAEVVIVSIWRLLGLVQHDRIFSVAAFVWVAAIVWAIAAGWVVLVGVIGFFAYHAEEPGPQMVLFLIPVMAVAVVGLLMVVMRALLHQATTLQTDMEAVI